MTRPVRICACHKISVTPISAGLLCMVNYVDKIVIAYDKVLY
jgi:hypothetical protein